MQPILDVAAASPPAPHAAQTQPKSGNSRVYSDGVIYHWVRGFLFFASSYEVHQVSVTRRPSIRLLCALHGRPMDIEFSDGTWIRARALLMAPSIKRRRVLASESGLVALDAGIGTPEYDALAPLLEAPVQIVNAGMLVPFGDAMDQAAAGELDGFNARQLVRNIVHSFAPGRPMKRVRDARITSALHLIESHRLGDQNLASLGNAVHLSPERLRHLFKEEVGCSLAYYMRSTAVWRALEMWSRGETLANLASETGFHDYSHFNRAFREMFGVNPSVPLKSGQTRLIRCA